MRLLVTESGVMLAEILVYMAVAAFLFAGVSGIFSSSLHSWQEGSRQAEVQQVARMALDSMVRELRQAVRLQYDQNKPHEITYIEPTKHEKIRFYEASGFLYRDSGSSPQPIAGVANQLSVKSVNFAVSSDFQVVDIELIVSWHMWNGIEKLECLKTTVYCVNSKNAAEGIL